MKKLKILTHLKILQLEGYQFVRYLRWAINAFRFWSSGVTENDRTASRNKLEWTLRAKLIGFILLMELILGVFFGLFGFIVGFLIFLIMPFVYLIFPTIISGWLVNVYELWVSKKIRTMLRKNDLEIIAITGSYGKTTTKEFLYRILDGWKYTLRTPGSYNTLLGIYKTLSMELNSKHKFFICEMGAFVQGDILRLAKIVSPNTGVITAIGSQHLERFGSLENVSSTKFELVDYVGNNNCLVNIGDDGVRKRLKEGFLGIGTYSAKEGRAADYQVVDIVMSEMGVKFDITNKGENYRFETSIFGSINLENVAGAIAAAMYLGVPTNIIKREVRALQAPEHRNQIHKAGKSIIIDNTYSSNEKGFSSVIDDVNKMKGKKVLITPGLVELGDGFEKKHESLGVQASSVFDSVHLVGQTKRTKAFERGLKLGKYTGRIVFEKPGTNPWDVFEKIKDKYDWVLMENDLPDSYY